VKIAVSVHGRFHAFDLARELHHHTALCQLFTTYPKIVAKRFLPAASPIFAAPWIELLRRCRGYIGAWGKDPALAASFGRFVRRGLSEEADLLVGWSGATLEAFDTARKLGIKVVIERGSTHIGHQTDVLLEEMRRRRLTGTPTHPTMIERELAEYALADAIAVPTSYAAETFVARGVPREKIIINPYGAALDGARPNTRRHRTEKPIILFVGGVSLRKGVPYLLDAFAPLAREAELHIVGPVSTDMRGIFEHRTLDGVTFHGSLRGNALKATYDRSDIFCLPSLEEGLPLALLTGMASGLPIVATKECGLTDVLTDGIGGIVVPSRDSEALAQALHQLVKDPPRRHAMGEAAFQRVTGNFSWSNYGDRAIAAYQRLLSQPEALMTSPTRR
jgi:glycosyltransferase involved in cell wall biosynthesis